MISGPTIPNTTQGLRNLLVDRGDLIEHGLTILSEDMVLGQEVVVDLFACDARGAPVFLFFALAEAGPNLTARVLHAQAWWQQNASFLGRELGHAQLRVDRGPRFMVLGPEILADALQELKRAPVPGLSVAQICSVTFGGRLRLGLTLLHESDTATPAAAEDAFAVPAGILDPAQRSLAARFMDLARRVDLGMHASGDRFSRRLFLEGRFVAQLGLADGQLTVSFPSLNDGFAKDCPVPAQTLQLDDETCLTAIDRMLRLVLAIEVGETGALLGRPRDHGGDVRPGRRLPAVDAPSAAEHDAAAAASSAAPSSAGPAGASTGETGSEAAAAAPDSGASPPRSAGLAHIEDRFSLEPIRRSVARAQLSREEFSALSDEGSDS